MNHHDETSSPTPPVSGDVFSLERFALLAQSDPAACVAEHESQIAAARARGDRDVEVQVTYFVGVAHHLLVDDSAALDLMGAALDLAVELGDPAWQARIKSGLASVHSAFGDNATSIDLQEQALEIRRGLDDQRGLAMTLNNLGATFLSMGDFWDRAHDLLIEAHDLFDGVGDDMGRCTALTNLAAVGVARSEQLAASDPVAAQALADEAARYADDGVRRLLTLQDVGRVLIDARLTEVRALLACGRAARAAEVFSAVDAQIAAGDLSPGDPLRLGVAVLRGRWRRMRGEHDLAVAELEAGLALAAGDDRPFERLDLLAELVVAQEQQGDHRAALATHREYHALVLRQRDEAAANRARLLNSRLDIDRARLEAEAERLRSAQLELDNRTLAYEATHDSLTGLANRRSFDALVAVRTEQPGSVVACLLGDLDHFKSVNDGFSHLVGDEVLRQAAQVVGACVRETDVVARFGGEELAILLSETDPVAVAEVAERIRAAVADHPWELIAPGLRVTISIGAAVRGPAEPATDLLRRADALLYAAKSTGRDRIAVDCLSA
ncbi:diguanylate cyclase [Cellulomonas sp. P22]|uniref:diguanylate cyclase n=1 Tax=Cellulomonas sp. P22 TaxID=3373189 RepID=UPI0037B3166F